MSFELTPVLKQRFMSLTTGLPLSGGLVYTYAAGTTTPLATYTDSTGLTPNANPVVLDSNGYANIWMGNNSYKFSVFDSASNLQFTTDNVLSIASQVAAISSTIQSVTMSYVAFQTAATSNAVQAFSLPANSLLDFVGIKHSTAFAGSGITDVNAQVGPTGNYQNIIENFDILQAVADQTFDNVSPGYIGSFVNPTAIYLNMVSTGANLSALTQGSVTVYYRYAAL